MIGKSPAIEILGMSMAAVTIVTSAGMLLKHEFQDLTFAGVPTEESESTERAYLPASSPTSSNDFSESMEGFSSVSNRAAANRIYRALEKPCPPLDYPRDTAMNDILEAIFDQLRQNEGGGFNILIDVAALDDDSLVMEDITVADFHVEGVSMRSALDELFEQIDPQLDYMVRSEVLLITTRAYAESDENLTVRVYDISHLVSPQSNAGKSQVKQRQSFNSTLPSSRQIAQWIVDTTSPPARWFDIDGEGGRLQIHNRMLIVRQSRRAHLAISDLLEQLTEHSDLLRK
ncbi:MAG: hypothetical protein O2856_05010 [Planctomycetota bacterium]|nr:hypothetical protein [Planctomycetota bacterium]